MLWPSPGRGREAKQPTDPPTTASRISALARRILTLNVLREKRRKGTDTAGLILESKLKSGSLSGLDPDPDSDSDLENVPPQGSTVGRRRRTRRTRRRTTACMVGSQARHHDAGRWSWVSFGRWLRVIGAGVTRIAGVFRPHAGLDGCFRCAFSAILEPRVENLEVRCDEKEI